MKLTQLALAGSLIVPLSALAADPSASGAAPAATNPSRVALGPAVTNAAGEQGHLHTVVRGETLWDVSEAYLGTPWVWPSIWKGESSGNGDASIEPGDVLWVSATEIRPLPPAEAAKLQPAAPAAAAAAPAAMSEPYDADAGAAANAIDRWVAFNAMGFIATERPGLVGEIIGNPTERAALGTGDVIYIDLGRGEVEVGDRLRVVRARRNIPDPDTGRLIGIFVEPLAWAEVTELEDESAAAILQGAVTEVMIGDQLVKSAGDGISIQPTSTPPQLSGEIVHMVGERVIGGGMDVVYLDQGAGSGLVPGSALEVVRNGAMVFDPVQSRRVKVPDTVVGHLLVLTTTPASSAAYVLHSTTDLLRGDRWRGAEVR